MTEPSHDVEGSLSSLTCTEVLQPSAPEQPNLAAAMERNENRLKDALSNAEQALLAESNRWEKLQASLPKRRNPRPLRGARTEHAARTESLRCVVWKQHARAVAQAYLLYLRRVDATTETLLEKHGALNKNLLDRAKCILMKWRFSLEAGDHVHCPDYMDEYECNDETRGFTKYYKAIVKEVAMEGSRIPVGDTSDALDARPMRTIGTGEKAIFVHYVGFGQKENRWILLSPTEDIASHVFPCDSHVTTLAALQKLYPTGVEQAESSKCESQPPSDCKPRGKKRKSMTRNATGHPKGGDSDVARQITDGTARKPSTSNKRKISPVRKGNTETVANGIITRDLHKGSSPEPSKRIRVGEQGEQIGNVGVKQHDNHAAKPVPMLQNGVKDPPSQMPHTLENGHDQSATLHSTNRKQAEGVPDQAHRHGASPRRSLDTKRSSETATIKSPPEQCNKEKPKRRRKSKEESESDFTWICTECKEAECNEDQESPLMICQGPCNRPFHYPCAGLARLPSADETWICDDCSKGNHQCIVCQQYGVDDHDVFCCKIAQCGRYFHESCLNMYNVEVELVEVETDQPSEESDDVNHVVSRPRFKCPAHQCWTCTEDLPPPTDETESAGNTKKRGKGRRKKSNSSLANAFATKKGTLYPCLECPIAYHSSCIPPVARFHELALLCHEHANTSELPVLDVESSFQGQVEARADKKLEQLQKDKKRKAELKAARRSGLDDDTPNPFFPGMRGDVLTAEETKLRGKLEEEDENFVESSQGLWTFCLPCDFKKEVHSKPPAYRQVHTLRYNPSNRPKRRPPTGESCRCKVSCDEDCLNRMVMMECVGDRSKSNGEKNPYWNCELGPNCGNRNLGQRKFAKCRPQREQGKGWGLISVNGTKKGELVQEYTGEVIDEQTKKERLEAWARDHPNDPNYYVMYLDTGWYIDARNEANMSRFINHSCNPNCHLVRVNVGGHMHVAIYCCRDVSPGEFLSYDYQFDTKHGDKFICRCGAPNCRGSMKAGATLEDGDEKKTKKQVMTEAKVRFERDKKFLEDAQRKETERLWQVGAYVPGATTKDGTETVASGPQVRYRDVALRNRVFLWRNVVQGANFAKRYDSMERGQSKNQV